MKFILFFSAFFLINIAFGQTGPIASFPFNGNANDQVGINHGIVYGASLTSDRFNNPNSAYSFDGIDDRISLVPTGLNLPEFSWGAWVNTNNTLAFSQMILSIGYLGGDQALSLYNSDQTPGNQKWNFFSYIYYAALPIPQTLVQATNAINQWHFVVGTRSLNELKFYLDGVLVSSASSGGVPPLYTSPNAATIGARSRNDIHFFSGKIDDVSIYNRAISDAEVMAIYTGAYPSEGNASLILQVNNSENDFIFNNGISPTETKELVRIKGTGKMGIGTANPKSTLEINGTFGTKLKKIVEEVPVIIDETAAVWYISNTSSVTLPPAAGAENRRYIIVNRKSQTKNLTNSYIALNNSVVNTIASNSSIEIISDGVNWLQIK